MVREYFLQVGEALDKKTVVGGPVYAANGSGEKIGSIVDYIPDNGFARIKIFYDVDYRDLVRGGIPLENIVFNGKA